jgi:UDP-2-acetamido-2-deoxy-ribo-hexuluronate aminotransferase
LDTLQAAILLAKLEVFDQELSLRQQIAARYTSMFASASRQSMHSVVLPYVEPHNTSVYAQFTIRVKNRDAVQKQMKQVGIPTAVHYPIPLNHQPAVADAAAQLPNGDEVARRVISLPMHPYLDFDDQQEIVSKIIQHAAP